MELTCVCIFVRHVRYSGSDKRHLVAVGKRWLLDKDVSESQLVLDHVAGTSNLEPTELNRVESRWTQNKSPLSLLHHKDLFHSVTL